jgi:hypothetical protein
MHRETSREQLDSNLHENHLCSRVVWPNFTACQCQSRQRTLLGRPTDEAGIHDFPSTGCTSFAQGTSRQSIDFVLNGYIILARMNMQIHILILGRESVTAMLVPMKIVLACEEGTLPLYQQYQERILGQYPKILLEGDRGTG